MTKQQKIRIAYKKFLPDLLKYYPYNSPYDLPQEIFNSFTPIEENVWHDIRVLALPMFPQFPILGYFLDFADPIKKIGIEVDGKAYHTNTEKDKKRQKEIEALGWKIIRIEGRKTFKDIFDYECSDENEEEKEAIMEKYNNECSEGILRKIKLKYYNERPVILMYSVNKNYKRY